MNSKSDGQPTRQTQEYTSISTIKQKNDGEFMFLAAL